MAKKHSFVSTFPGSGTCCYNYQRKCTGSITKEESSRVSREHESANTPAASSVRPKIANIKQIKKAVKKADIVYIGYPIWWGEAPHIIYSLVESTSLKGKTVVPFCTSLSSGLGKSGSHLKVKAIISKKTKWNKGKNFYGRSSQKTVNKWVRKIK